MAQIRDIRKRIKSITNTQKVTHAMELVAAAKMRKSQFAALSARPYSLTLDQIIAQVKAKTEHKVRLLRKNDSPNQIIILVSSDRGLAGGLNINLFREILKADLKNAQFITVGKKAQNFAVKTANVLIASYRSEEKEPLDLARTLTKMAIDAYIANQASKVSILYPHFESTIKQVPTAIQLLPIELSGDQLLMCGQMGSVAAVYTVEKYGTQTHTFTKREFINRYAENYSSVLSL